MIYLLAAVPFAALTWTLLILRAGAKEDERQAMLERLKLDELNRKREAHWFAHSGPI